MRYVQARVDEARRERAYRIYVTDGLKVLCDFETRYADVVSTKEVQENRSADEIISGIRNRLNAIKRGEA